MLLLEINEFNPELLERATVELELSAVQQFFSACKHTHSLAAERDERHGLDPWVQWPSVHTGKLSDEHKLYHLGDVEHLSHRQLWEELGQRGYKCGVWGAMNAKLGEPGSCTFFLPDPWTYSEPAYPPELNELLTIPRYYAKNYLDLKITTLLIKSLALIRFTFRPHIFKCLTSLAPTIIFHILRYGLKSHILFSLFDLVNVSLFCVYYKRYRPDFSILFLNSLAHLQHHKWTSDEELSREMKICFRLFDKMLDLLQKHLGLDYPVVIANAFRQNYSYDKHDYLYRQSNPYAFLEALGIKFDKLEQLMTNDAHIFFSNQNDLSNAENLLKNTTIDGQRIFDVQRRSTDKLSLFFQLDIWQKIPEDTKIISGSAKLKFYDYFEEVTRRSGTHIRKGDIFTNVMELPEEIPLHKLNKYILDYFGHTR